MTSGRWFRAVAAVVVVILAVGGAALILLASNAPGASSVAVKSCVTAGNESEACIVFPTVSGANLLGETMTLPGGLAGKFNLVVVSFDEGQTQRVLDWLPTVQRLTEQYDNFAFYNVPTLKSLNPVMRGIITTGMTVFITEPDLQAITIMLFLDDLDLFMQTLHIPDNESIQAFLLNAGGEVLWRGTGDYSDSLGAELTAALDAAQTST